MAIISVRLNNNDLAERVTALLQTSRHTIVRQPGFSPKDAAPKAVEELLSGEPDVVIMDYLAEDAASVKMLQCSTDRADRPEFIFIDGEEPSSREHVMMAVNEGARAIMPRDFSDPALLNYVERALIGPGRLRFPTHDRAEENDRRLEEQLGAARSRMKSFEKLIAYLLRTPVSSQARKALVVSDSPYQREILKKQLEDHGFMTLVAPHATEGLSLALSENPRVIISDLELEGQTGVDFCREVKLVAKLAPCYFVICTANQDKFDQIMTPGNGVDDCLLKPGGQSGQEEFVARAALGLLL